MRAKPDLSVKPSEAGQVDAYMRELKHPLAEVAEALRRAILEADREIGEEIKWNAPAFFYTGEMRPFNPKEHKRHIVVFNFQRKDCIRLVFLNAAQIDETGGLLQGDYRDGRRLASFTSTADVQFKKAALQQVLQEWLTLLDRE